MGKNGQVRGNNLVKEKNKRETGGGEERRKRRTERDNKQEDKRDSRWGRIKGEKWRKEKKLLMGLIDPVFTSIYWSSTSLDSIVKGHRAGQILLKAQNQNQNTSFQSYNLKRRAMTSAMHSGSEYSGFLYQNGDTIQSQHLRDSEVRPHEQLPEEDIALPTNTDCTSY